MVLTAPLNGQGPVERLGRVRSHLAKLGKSQDLRDLVVYEPCEEPSKSYEPLELVTR